MGEKTLACFTAGNAFYKKGQFEEALSAYNTALQNNLADKGLGPGSFTIGSMVLVTSKSYYLACSSIHYVRGLALAALGRHPEAIVVYEQALSNNASCLMTHYNMGLSLAAVKQHRKALKAYAKALELKQAPVFAAEIHYRCGMIHEGFRSPEGLEREDAGRARDAYAAALKNNPELVQAYHRYGITFYDYAQASLHFSLAIAVGMDNDWDRGKNCGSRPDATCNLTVLEAHRNAVKFNPEFAEAHCSIGDMLCILQQPDEAIKAYHKALEINPKLIEAYYGLGNALGILEQYEQALTAYDKVWEIDPKYPQINTCSGFIPLPPTFKCPSEAIYDDIWEMEPRYRGAKIHVDRSLTLLKLKRPREAIQACLAALKINPTAFSARVVFKGVTGQKYSTYAEKQLKTHQLLYKMELFGSRNGGFFSDFLAPKLDGGSINSRMTQIVIEYLDDPLKKMQERKGSKR